MFDSRDVAAYIAQECDRRNISYNNTKIQKLLYCVYGVMLAWKGNLACDETPRCWPHGPVFPKVFAYIHKGNNISAYSDTVRNDNNPDISTAVESVLDEFGSFTASALSDWSHSFGSPWDKTIRENGEHWNIAIPAEYIREYFSNEVLNENATHSA